MVKPRRKGKEQVPTTLVSARWIMVQPTFRLGVNDAAGRLTPTTISGTRTHSGTTSEAEPGASSLRSICRCRSAASSTKRLSASSVNAAGQSYKRETHVVRSEKLPEEQRLKASSQVNTPATTYRGYSYLVGENGVVSSLKMVG
jgi:hypothetical protein